MKILVAFIVVIGAGIALATGSVALVGACRKALKRNTTGDFLDNVWDGISGNAYVAMALLILILPVYLSISIVVSIRLLCGANGGITRQHVLSSVLGAVIPAFIGIPLYLYFREDASTWWAVGLAGLILACAIVGLSHPGWKHKFKIDLPTDQEVELPPHANDAIAASDLERLLNDGSSRLNPPSPVRSKHHEVRKGASVGNLEARLWRYLFKLEHVRGIGPELWSKGKAQVLPSRYLVAAAMLFDHVCYPAERAEACRAVASAMRGVSQGVPIGVHRVPYQAPELDVLCFCNMEASEFITIVDGFIDLGLLSDYVEDQPMPEREDPVLERCGAILNGSLAQDPDFLDLSYLGSGSPDDSEKRKQLLKNLTSAGRCIHTALREGAVPLLQECDALLPALQELFPQQATVLKVFRQVVEGMGHVRMSEETLAALRSSPDVVRLRTELHASGPDSDGDQLVADFLSQIRMADADRGRTARE